MNTQGHATLGAALAAALGVHALVFWIFAQDSTQHRLTKPLQLTLLPHQVGDAHIASKHELIQQQQPAKQAKPEHQMPRKTAVTPHPEIKAKPKIEQHIQQTSQAKGMDALISDNLQHKSGREHTRQPSPKQLSKQQATASVIPQYIQQQILARIIYPRQAKRRGLEGTVKFALDVQKHGVQHVTLLVSTGYQILDRAAYKGVASLQSLPLPDGRHLLPVTFRLRQ